jgi:GT2 family glycosyltransferase
MTRAQPFFSIIVPTYNRPANLAACLESLLRLDYPRDCFEVIVVDDGGALPLEACRASIREHLDVTFLAQAHAGPAVARNTGAGRAKGEFLAFTDDDCAPAPDWLQALAARFAQDPDAAIAGHVLNALPDNVYSTASQLLIDYLHRHYNADVANARFLTSNNLALSADRFRAIGGFDAGFPLAAGEDRELCDRLLHHGCRVIYAPEVVLNHAHPLTLRTFWRLHFNYGRGAFRFHQVAARRRQGRFQLEPLSFHVNLIRFPFSQARGWRAFFLSVLVIVSQVALGAGIIWEWMQVGGEKVRKLP